MLQSARPLCSSSISFPPSCPCLSSLPQVRFFISQPTLPYRFTSAARRTASLAVHSEPPDVGVAQLADASTITTPGLDAYENGPVELPPYSDNTIFATDDDPTPLQVSTSVLLTGAITIFLFRSIRRRAKRAKESRFRSTGVKKPLKEEALDSLKAIGLLSVEPGAPPSPLQALLGGIGAGVIALILYKFTTTVEASLSRQTISDNYSVRQITVTIRTIINGICYLATFVFGFNSVGLFLYAGQLATKLIFESPDGKNANKDVEKQDGPLMTTEIENGVEDPQKEQK